MSPFDEGWQPPKQEPAPAAADTRAPSYADARSPIAHAPSVVDGIYFRMPADTYHAVERLSVSGMQNLLVSPATFWANSYLNPGREDVSNAARLHGSAYHTARLEPNLFDGAYVRGLAKEEMPEGTPITGKDMEVQLAKLGQPKSGSVMEQAMRLRAAGFNAPIWQLELAAWEGRRGNRTALPADVYDQIVEDGRRLRASPQIAELLTGGAAEVSVFWTCPRTSLPMKMRVDYLKAAAWVDLKTFDNTRGKRLEQAIADAFRYNRYYIQAVGYRDGIEAIRNGLVEIVGEASDTERDLFAAIQLAPAPLACWYVFQEKKGVPNIVGRRFLFDDLPASHAINKAGLDEEREARAAAAIARPTAIARKAEAEIAYAKKLFRGYSEIYGRGEPWLPFEPLSTIGDDDFAPYWLEGRGE